MQCTCELCQRKTLWCLTPCRLTLFLGLPGSGRVSIAGQWQALKAGSSPMLSICWWPHELPCPSVLLCLQQQQST